MKTLIFIPVLILTTSFQTFSQDKKNQINFSIGPSFAIGNFGDKSLSNEYAGSAGMGVDLYLYYGHKFSKNFGIGIKWLGNSNKYDTDALIEEMNNASGGFWTTVPSYWGNGALLAGVTAHVPCSEKFIVDFRLLGGFATASSPESTFTDSFSNAWVKLESEAAVAFGYDIGAGLTFLFTPKWGVNFNVDYFGANFIFDDIVITGSDGSSDHVYDAKQSVSVINTTFGISFYF